MPNNTPKKFKKVGRGEWQQPIEKGYLMKCCDCGLVHSVDFRLYGSPRGYKIQFRMFRVTKNLRRK